MAVDREAYDRYLNSPRWAVVRTQAFAHYGKACQACGAKERLHVHHVTYERFGGKERMADLRILCEQHHDIVHLIHRKGGTGKTLVVVTDTVIRTYKKPPLLQKKKRPSQVAWAEAQERKQRAKQNRAIMRERKRPKK